MQSDFRHHHLGEWDLRWLPCRIHVTHHCTKTHGMPEYNAPMTYSCKVHSNSMLDKREARRSEPEQEDTQGVTVPQDDGGSVSLDLVLELVQTHLPRNVVATSIRQLCQAKHEELRQSVTVHVCDADLPSHTLVWAFQHRLTRITERHGLLRSRSAAGDLEQVEWLVQGWQETERARRGGEGDGWFQLWELPPAAGAVTAARAGSSYASSSRSSKRKAPALAGSSEPTGRGKSTQHQGLQQYFCPWLDENGEMAHTFTISSFY